jgi:hypothetical protein
MGRTTELREAVKRDFVPFLRDKGFTLDMSDGPLLYSFRKIDSDVVLECNVQWEKYGSPRFILNFFKRGPKGLIASGRLAPSQRRTLAGWFRQDRPWLSRLMLSRLMLSRLMLSRLISSSKLYPPEQVVAQLIALFDEVEEYWKSGKVGPHIRLLPVPRLERADKVSVARESGTSQ